MADGSLKQQSKKGLIWSVVERFSVQGLSFLFMIFLARILTPADYGLIGMLSIFMALAQTLIDSGFSQALIRKQDRTEVDNCTVFYFNLFVGIFLYIAIYISAPIIAAFYNQPLLAPITRTLAFCFVINSLAVVQRALLTINLDFRTQAKAGIIASIVSGALGLILAYKSFGVWALVWLQLSNCLVDVFFLWIFSKWKPQILYSWTSFKELFSFGSKLLGVGLIDTTWNNLYPIIIGKLYDASILGYYTRASSFSQFPSGNFTGIIQRVSYPILCKIQDDDERLRSAYRKILKLSAFVVFPLMLGLSACSESLIAIVIGEKWLYSASLLTVICFSMMWYPIHVINLNLLQVKGQSGIFLKLEFIKKAVLIVSLIISAPLGVIAMCYAGIVTCFISLFINSYYTGKLINVGFIVQICDLIPIFFVCMGMWSIIKLLNIFISSYSIQLILDVIVGVTFFITITKFFKFTEWNDIMEFIPRKKS